MITTFARRLLRGLDTAMASLRRSQDIARYAARCRNADLLRQRMGLDA